MEALNNLIGTIGGFAWGPVMIILLVGTGVLLTLGTRIVQFRKLLHAFRLLVSKEHTGDGDITPFQALMTSLSATIGTGNIAGVATAIASGGPGAIFWMWVTGAVGGSMKFGEAVLAVKYRVRNDAGEQSGGPMYYIKHGMKERFGGNWAWLGWSFALFGFVASFGIGNMVQSNSVAAAMQSSLGIAPWITGIIIALATALVIIGGIKSIAKVTSKIVPAMAIIYIVGSLIVLASDESEEGGGGDIITEATFDDFELSLEFQLSPVANSGILYRVVESPGSAIWHSAPEYQVLDDTAYIEMGTMDMHTRLTGDNYDMHASSLTASNPIGEWNHARIVVDGAHVEHWLNGQLTVEYDLWTPEWEQLVRESKFAEYPGYGRAELGHIGLQDHGHTLRYRNIKIRPIEH